jgi:hypothetical protein
MLPIQFGKSPPDEVIHAVSHEILICFKFVNRESGFPEHGVHGIGQILQGVE